jgi:hypothetical protein
VGQVDEGPEDYTVILLYPDYASDTYGQETWCGHVQAVDAGAALEAARDEMIAENKKLGLEFESRDDLFPIALFQGKHDDLSSLCV